MSYPIRVRAGIDAQSAISSEESLQFQAALAKYSEELDDTNDSPERQQTYWERWAANEFGDYFTALGGQIRANVLVCNTTGYAFEDLEGHCASLGGKDSLEFYRGVVQEINLLLAVLGLEVE